MNIEPNLQSNINSINRPLSQQNSNITHQNQYSSNNNRMQSDSNNSSSGSGSNYLLMKNVDKIKSSSNEGSQSYYSISPNTSQQFNTLSNNLSNNYTNGILLGNNNPITNQHLQLKSNTIKQHIQLPLTYRPLITTTYNNSPIKQTNRRSIYKTNNIQSINQQQQHNYKFQYIQLKAAYQQLKQSHQMLLKDYQSIRQRVVVIRNNQQLLSIRNDQLIRNNGILQNRVYQLQEEVKVSKLVGQQQRLVGSNMYGVRPQLQNSRVSFTNINKQSPIKTTYNNQPPIVTTSTSTFNQPPPIMQSSLPPIIPTYTLPTSTNYYQPSLLQLQHQNRQLLYRTQQYQSSIIYKNSQINKLSIQLKDKLLEINSLRRQVQTYLKRQTIYHQNQELIQNKIQQVQTLQNNIQIKQRQIEQFQKQNTSLKDQNNQYQHQNQQLKQQINSLKQTQHKIEQLQRQNQQYKQIITNLQKVNINLQKVNKQYQISHTIHQKLLQNLQPYSNYQTNTNNQQGNPINADTYQNSINSALYQNSLNPSVYQNNLNSGVYQGIINQDFSKVQTTYIGDQTNPNNQQQHSLNQFSKINTTLYNNLKNLNLSNQTLRQNVPVIKLTDHVNNQMQFNNNQQVNSIAYKLADNMPYQNQSNQRFTSSHPHNHTNHKQNQNHSLTSQLYEGMKQQKHFNRQPSNFNIEDQAYFDFNRQNTQTPTQNNNRPSQQQNKSLTNLNNPLNALSESNLKLHYQKLNLIEKLTQGPAQFYQSTNILSFPQLPFTINSDDIKKHQQKINTVTFADQPYHSPPQNDSLHQLKSKKHNRIFTQQNTPNLSSLETLQNRIQDLAQQNKSLRHYLVKKST